MKYSFEFYNELFDKYQIYQKTISREKLTKVFFDDKILRSIFPSSLAIRYTPDIRFINIMSLISECYFGNSEMFLLIAKKDEIIYIKITSQTKKIDNIVSIVNKVCALSDEEIKTNYKQKISNMPTILDGKLDEEVMWLMMKRYNYGKHFAVSSIDGNELSIVVVF
jgi:hypothetical protein